MERMKEVREKGKVRRSNLNSTIQITKLIY